MKIVLVFFNGISKNSQASVEFTSYCLAKRLLDEGGLAGVVCLSLDKNVDIPEEYFAVFGNRTIYKILFRVLSFLQRRVRHIHTRWIREVMFDRYAANNLGDADIVFCARPLFSSVAKAARTSGKEIWVQTLTPHPLQNYKLVRGEEQRLGLDNQGGYSNLTRADKLANLIAKSDRLLTLAPEIAQFTYDSYTAHIDPAQIIGLKHYFSVDQEAYQNIGANRTDLDEEREITFLHVSFMNLIKGIPYLLAAWEQLQEKHSVQARLLLVGRVDSNIDRIIQEQYPALANVEILGYVPDLPQCYAQADVFVSPSISDAGPATILEAMSAGLPVISSRNCGFATLIEEGKQGYTYQYDDVDKLSQLMLEFCQNVDSVRTMGQHAQQRVQDFSVDKYVAELVGQLTGGSPLKEYE